VTEGGAQRMVRIAELVLPAGATVILEPGGLHVMLIDIVAPLVPGTNVALHLTFANGAPIDVIAPVIDARTTPALRNAPR